MISAKALSGNVYQYPAKTAREFKEHLSRKKGIDLEVIKLFLEEELDDSAELYEDHVYYLFLDYGNGLKKGVDPSKLDWTRLSRNTAAIPFLEDHLDKVDWDWLSYNPAARDLLARNLDKVDWDALSTNPGAIDILYDNLDKVNWRSFSSNPAAVPYLERNPDKIDWRGLSSNPAALRLIEENMDKVDLKILCGNPTAFHLVKPLIPTLTDIDTYLCSMPSSFWRLFPWTTSIVLGWEIIREQTDF